MAKYKDGYSISGQSSLSEPLFLDEYQSPHIEDLGHWEMIALSFSHPWETLPDPPIP